MLEYRKYASLKLRQGVCIICVVCESGRYPITFLRWQAQHSFAYDLQCQQSELLLHVNSLPRALGSLQLHADPVCCPLPYSYLHHDQLSEQSQ